MSDYSHTVVLQRFQLPYTTFVLCLSPLFLLLWMYLVGPLTKSAQGHGHIQVIVSYATRYPEAIPLRKATAKAIAQELFLLSS
ncbi:hypothetical protein QQF64_036234 [Cirrhinus molitorella]|uniref:Uncharacterized protein n=1 Tax=Cirrhinus molitorella TaxID=172907 RepID=A0ABR3NI03_9TELE